MTDPSSTIRASCMVCGDLFKPGWPGQKCCSLLCGQWARARWAIDSALKADFVGQLRRRRIPVSVAASEMGLSRGTLNSWLRTQGGRLHQQTLERVAVWLNLSTQQAVMMQGGTAEERQHAIALEALQKANDALHRSRRKRTKSLKAAHASISGCPFTEEHKRNLSESLKAARALKISPGIGQHNRTLRGRAQNTAKSLRHHHPDWTADQVANESARRLLEPPCNVRTKREALALIAPRQPRLRRVGGRPRRTDWYKIIELRAGNHGRTWEDIAAEIDADPDNLRRAFFEFLTASQ
jgi:hypothetical protein